MISATGYINIHPVQGVGPQGRARHREGQLPGEPETGPRDMEVNSEFHLAT